MHSGCGPVDWCCSVSMVYVQILSREEQKNCQLKDLIITLFGLIFRPINIYIKIYIRIILWYSQRILIWQLFQASHNHTVDLPYFIPRDTELFFFSLYVSTSEQSTQKCVSYILKWKRVFLFCVGFEPTSLVHCNTNSLSIMIDHLVLSAQYTIKYCFISVLMTTWCMVW